MKWTDRTGGDASPAGLAVARFADELFSRIDKLKLPASIRNGRASTL